MRSAGPASNDEMFRANDAIQAAATHYREGRLGEAEKICNRLLKSWPELFDAHHLLGVVKLAAGKTGAARSHFERALEINPQFSQAHSNLAMALALLNCDAEALAAAERAIALSPDNVEAHNNRGNVLMKLGRPADALAAFRRATTMEPRFLSARVNRGNALAALGRHADAVAQYDEVLTAAPAYADALINRASALAELGRSAEALAGFDAALAARPDDVKALTARAGALQALNRNAEAIETCRRALALDKSFADAHHNMSLALLTLGEFARGFAEFEWRWQRTGMPARRRSLGKPLWRGEYPLARKTILLHAEQGLGDTIQFARYAPVLARSGATVVLEVTRELAGLMRTLPGIAQVVARGDALPAFDVHCPLASLPLALRTEVSTIPAGVPYLSASPEHLEKWRARLADLPSPRIALAWSGSASHPNDRNRSIPLARLAPLLNIEGASFISIQRDLRADDAGTLSDLPRLRHVGAELDDFDDTAAVLSLVDRVITVDTAPAHLAGALGRPTCILLPFCPDWRWMLERGDSPLYPTARLYRQSAPGDWDSVIASLAAELAGGSDQAWTDKSWIAGRAPESGFASSQP